VEVEFFVSNQGATPAAGLHELAAQVNCEDASTRHFVSEALASIEALAAALACADRGLPDEARAGFLDAAHRGRLEDLIEQQDQVISRLSATIARLQAAADLAEWAVDLAGSRGPASLPVSDLRLALRD
jgi:HPt (histidine-containing phosphotransfer) domain-containing protein